jgi:hypothetical protein
MWRQYVAPKCLCPSARLQLLSCKNLGSSNFYRFNISDNVCVNVVCSKGWCFDSQVQQIYHQVPIQLEWIHSCLVWQTIPVRSLQTVDWACVTVTPYHTHLRTSLPTWMTTWMAWVVSLLFGLFTDLKPRRSEVTVMWTEVTLLPQKQNWHLQKLQIYSNCFTSLQ